MTKQPKTTLVDLLTGLASGQKPDLLDRVHLINVAEKLVELGPEVIWHLKELSTKLRSTEKVVKQNPFGFDETIEIKELFETEERRALWLVTSVIDYLTTPGQEK